MQEIARILEEIEREKKKRLDVVKVEVDPMEIMIHREQYKGLCMAEEIIREHMNNGGWIPVEERLPGNGETALCTDGHSIYLVEYEADSDAAFGDIDGITAWMPLPEPYRAVESDGEEGEKGRCR